MRLLGCISSGVKKLNKISIYFWLWIVVKNPPTA